MFPYPAARDRPATGPARLRASIAPLVPPPARPRDLLTIQRVAFLNIGLAEGVRRTGLSSARPLLAGVNPRAKFKELLDARMPLYREVATVEVTTDSRSPDAIVVPFMK